MRLIVIAAMVFCTSSFSAQHQMPTEMVHIDGKKNPEMIPQWSVWETVFRAFSGAKDLPTDLYRQLTREEMDEIRAASKAFKETYDPCLAHGAKELRELLQSQTEKKMEVLNERTQAVNLGCRKKILKIRDELLEKLRPEARVAVNQWVEDAKKFISVSVLKRELAFYMKPE